MITFLRYFMITWTIFSVALLTYALMNADYWISVFLIGVILLVLGITPVDPLKTFPRFERKRKQH